MYSEYEHIVESLLNGKVHHHQLPAVHGFAVDGDALLADARRVQPEVILLVNPNNPTGRLWPRQQVIRFLDQLPANVLTIVDEAYLDFAGSAESLESESLESEAARRPNLIVVKSMSKVYALSGARVAYLVTNALRAAQLRPWLPPWPVGLLAQAAAMEALRDPSWYVAKYAETHQLRAHLRERLASLRPVESSVNFFLIEPPDPAALAAALRQRRIFVREFPDGPLAGRYLRVTVKDPGQNQRLADALLARR
jgi:histidinol-phosphate/aromatic aminotransferase/cobyric acid decarboxylase-like protein